ncbi:MAG TPA: FAD-dependent monooxygenase [Ktedonobacteraceae bacterium]|nr:FAD-dependent monooxygenase [Ktedonobacteraceae bacterium]
MVEQALAQLQPCADWQDPLLIIGAGPVGMTAALGLAHYGIPSIVLDDGEGTALEGSRAIFMERHTLEVLGAWSPVGRQLAEMGMTLTGGRVFFRKTELYKTLSAPPEPDMPYPRFVNMPQNVLERLQYDALQELACCEVRWRHKVSGISQDRQGVRVEVTTPDGVIELTAPYVLVADGPRSTVRRLLNLNFPGHSRDQHFLILDVRMQLETPRERWFWFDPPFNPGRTALLHPQPESIYRLDYQLPPDEDLTEVMQPASLHQRIIATVGERPYEIVWKSIYTYQQRVLERFCTERVFFMGDAAHLMSPFGGRGLNSGVQDVWNLVWKLALVRAGCAPTTLLNTYHEERYAAALENIRLTDDTMRFLVPQSGFARWRRDTILRACLPFKFMRRYVNAGHMSNPFTYRDSPIISEDPQLTRASLSGSMQRVAGRWKAGREKSAEQLARFRLGPVAGALAPAVPLTDATTNEAASMLDQFGESFVVLYFCTNMDAGIKALQSIQGDLPPVPLSCSIVAATPPTVPVPSGMRVLLDVERRAAVAYNAGEQTLYLVRPDRHIATRRFQSDATELPLLLRHALAETLAINSSAHQSTQTDLVL